MIDLPPRGGWDSNPRPCGWEPPRARPLSYTRHPLGHLFHGFHWFMIDSLIYDWFMIDLWLIPPPAGLGIEPATLWLRAAACKTTGLYPSSPPSGTQNTLWYPKQIQNTQELIHHLEKNRFWGRWTFLDLFPKIPRSRKRRFWQKWCFERKLWKNRKAMSLFLI